jgi:acid phosphatase type 7
VVYLNGVEVARRNLPTGTIGYTTLASTAAAEGVLETITVPPARLVEGDNVIAVEIHQSARSSSDISFDLELVVGR